jgi:hypothetical protein
MVITKQKFLIVNFNFNLTPRWQIWYTEMTNLLQSTLNVLKSHRHPQRTSQLSCEDRVFFVKVVLCVCLWGQQDPKCQRSIRLLYPPFFCTLRSSSNLKKMNGFKQLSLGNHTALHTMFLCTFFSQWPIPSRPRILIFPPERACVAQLYIQVPVFPGTKKLLYA